MVKLEQSDYDKEPCIISCREKGIAILVAILVIDHRAKPIFKLILYFDESTLIYDIWKRLSDKNQVRVSTSVN